jgi:hypothetical protein
MSSGMVAEDGAVVGGRSAVLAEGGRTPPDGGFPPRPETRVLDVPAVGEALAMPPAVFAGSGAASPDAVGGGVVVPGSAVGCVALV